MNEGIREGDDLTQRALESIRRDMEAVRAANGILPSVSEIDRQTDQGPQISEDAEQTGDHVNLPNAEENDQLLQGLGEAFQNIEEMLELIESDPSQGIREDGSTPVGHSEDSSGSGLGGKCALSLLVGVVAFVGFYLVWNRASVR